MSAVSGLCSSSYNGCLRRVGERPRELWVSFCWTDLGDSAATGITSAGTGRGALVLDGPELHRSSSSTIVGIVPISFSIIPRDRPPTSLLSCREGGGWPLPPPPPEVRACLTGDAGPGGDALPRSSTSRWGSALE